MSGSASEYNRYDITEILLKVALNTIQRKIKKYRGVIQIENYKTW
jgi:hypothetical protein